MVDPISLRGLFERRWPNRLAGKWKSFIKRGGDDIVGVGVAWLLGYLVGFIATLVWWLILLPVRAVVWAGRRLVNPKRSEPESSGESQVGRE